MIKKLIAASAISALLLFSPIIIKAAAFRDSDISELKNLPNLQALNLENDKVVDINTFKDFSNLMQLDLSGNGMSDLDIQELKKALPTCSIQR